MGRPIKIHYRDAEYCSLAQASKELGCSTVFIKNAWDKAKGNQAVFEDMIANYKSAKSPIEVDGYRFDSLSEAERATGISSRLLRRIKMESQGDEEFTKKVMEEAEGFYALGEWYWSIRQASDKLGVNEKDLQQIFDRYNFSQDQFDCHVSALVENTYKW